MYANLQNFLSDADFPVLGKRPDLWPDAVKALRNEMTTHVVILVSAYLFNLEIVVINWQGVSANNLSNSLIIHEVKSQSLVNRAHMDT